MLPPSPPCGRMWAERGGEDLEPSYEDMMRKVAKAEKEYKKINQDLSKMIEESTMTLSGEDAVIAAQKHTASFKKMTADVEMLIEREQKQKQATLDIAAELKLLNEKVETSRQEQNDSAKIAARQQNRTLLIGILTLIATVLIGVVSILLQMQPPQQPSQQGTGDSAQTVASDDVQGG
jgi:hypothetical protein